MGTGLSGNRPGEGPELDLEIQLATDETPVPAGADFAGWVRAALTAAGVRGAGALCIRLVGSAEGTRLNQEWRGKPAPTNVLAFPGPVSAPGLPAELPVEHGDLVICLPVMAREAAEQGRPPCAHLAHLVVHGTLHLAGFTHEGEADAARMEALESRIMAGLGFPDPYVTM